MDSGWLQRHQVGIYAIVVLAAIGFGLVFPDSARLAERLITPVLAVLLYVTFLEIPFVRFRDAFTNIRFITTGLGVNFLVVPIVVFILTRFLPQTPAIVVGVYMVLLTPCIDYVIAFTDLADGNAEQVTAITPALLFIQFLLLPVYLWLFMGGRFAEIIEAGPFVEAFVLIIALPLLLAWLTEWWAANSVMWRQWQESMSWFPVPMMAVTLLVVIVSQFPRVQNSIEQIGAVIPVYVAFLIVMPLIGRIAASLVGMNVGDARALVFTSVTRNSLVILPLAIALPSGYELVPAVIVTQTLVELSGMVVLTRVVPAWLLPDTPTPNSLPGNA